MSEGAQRGKGPDILTPIAVIFFVIAKALAIGIFLGAKRTKTWTKEFAVGWTLYSLLVLAIVYSPSWNLTDFLSLLWPRVAGWIYWHVGFKTQASILFFVPFSFSLAALGFVDWIKRRKLQGSIEHLGLKTPTGLTPQVIDVIPLDNHQKKVLVKAIGIDVAEFQSKQGVLESSFNSIVQEIRVSKTNKQIVEIILADEELPEFVSFEEAMEQVKKPYSFVVGLSSEGYILADLCDIHHMIIAGSTGGGKSGFFKQTVVGLLRSSVFLQMYLIDLKRVDAKPFEALSNVRVIKENIQAISCLEAVVREMERRYAFLDDSGRTEIDPERDKLDRIVVGIDEASLLFTVEKHSKATKVQAEKARELADKIAKLGRAAGIHLILATQKVVKDTIDTRVQANINSKMCFRVNTQLSSITVLGHKGASELPKIPGRGIWSVGTQEDVVQVPKLSNEDTIEQIENLTLKFNDASPLKQSLIFAQATSKNTRGFRPSTSPEIATVAEETA